MDIPVYPSVPGLPVQATVLIAPTKPHIIVVRIQATPRKGLFAILPRRAAIEHTSIIKKFASMMKNLALL